MAEKRAKKHLHRLHYNAELFCRLVLFKNSISSAVHCTTDCVKMLKRGKNRLDERFSHPDLLFFPACCDCIVDMFV